MRKPDVYSTWPRRSWPLLIAVIGGTLSLLPFAVGQGPKASVPEEQRPRAQFGAVQAVSDKPPPAAVRVKQPEKDAAKKKPGPGDKETSILLYAMPLTPPSPEQLFRLDSEAVFRDRLRAEVRKRFPKLELEFPAADAPVAARPPVRDWPSHVKRVEPNYVLSKRLFFEQPRFERYGESLGVLQPGVSTAVFGMDLVLWPAHRLAQPFRCYQVNTDCYSPYFQMAGE